MGSLKKLWIPGWMTVVWGFSLTAWGQTLYTNNFPPTDPLTGWVQTSDAGTVAGTDYTYGVDNEFFHRVSTAAGAGKTMQSYFNGTDLQGHSVTDGTWRDVSVTSKVRSLANYRAGIGLRLDTDLTSSNPLTTNGYWAGYISLDSSQNTWRLGVCRWNNGVAEWLGYSDSFTMNQWDSYNSLEASIQNILTGTGIDQVRISVNLYNNSQGTPRLLETLTYVDSSDKAITRAGGVGYQSRINVPENRAVYDDLRVNTLSPGLLYYDDFSDNMVKNMTLGSKISVADGRLVHTGGYTVDGREVGSVSQSEVDSRWENVTVSTSIWRPGTDRWRWNLAIPGT